MFKLLDELWSIKVRFTRPLQINLELRLRRCASIRHGCQCKLSVNRQKPLILLRLHTIDDFIFETGETNGSQIERVGGSGSKGETVNRHRYWVLGVGY